MKNNQKEKRLLLCCGCCLVAKSCLTLCDPMDCSPPGSSVHEISQARILECIAISFSRGSSIFPIRALNLRLLHWQADSLPLSDQEGPEEKDHLKNNGK